MSETQGERPENQSRFEATKVRERLAKCPPYNLGVLVPCHHTLVILGFKDSDDGSDYGQQCGTFPTRSIMVLGRTDLSNSEYLPGNKSQAARATW
jgi:hypothetical protein